MNKKTATHNASDVYNAWITQMLEENPDLWTKYSKATERRHEFVYKMNQKDEPIEVMSFARWRRIVQIYFLLARKAVIEGKRVKLGHRLGAIRARTISRNFKKKKIDFNETRKQPYVIDPITGRRHRAKIIYFTSDTYSKIAWEKLGSITNETLYKFVPSGGSKARGGFKEEFKTAMRENPLLSAQFKQCIDELIPVD